MEHLAKIKKNNPSLYEQLKFLFCCYIIGIIGCIIICVLNPNYNFVPTTLKAYKQNIQILFNTKSGLLVFTTVMTVAALYTQKTLKKMKNEG